MAVLRGYAFIVSASILWGTIGVAFKIGLESGASYEWLIAGRPLTAGLIALAVLAARGLTPSRWSALIGLLALTPLYVTYPLAVERIGAALSSVLLYTAPLWVVASSALVLGERLTAFKAVAVALGVGGVALISLPGGLTSLEPLGLALGLASGVTYAAYIVLARLSQVRGARPEEASLGALAFTGPAVYALLRPEGLPDLGDVPFILYLGVAATLLPYYLHVRGLSVVEAGRASIASLVEPIVAVALAVVLLGETLNPAQAAGSAMILAAVALVALEEARAGRS